MRLLVDGVAFQRGDADAARLWATLLPRLGARADLDLLVLDRGGLPPLAGVARVPFPTYRHRYTADDSALIQRMCDFLAIDAFTTTQATSPLATPMLLLLPGRVAAEPGGRAQQEAAIAIAFARAHICLSPGLRDDLLALHPALDRVTVAPAGIDGTIVRPADADAVAAFRRRAGFDARPYLVTSADDAGAASLFETIARFGIDAFDLLCIDGAGPDRHRAAGLPAAVRVRRIAASDADYTAALSGAGALVHLPREEGSGLPVLEAMACGCPVVTTRAGIAPDVLRDGCLVIDGSGPALRRALKQLESPGVREALGRAAQARAAAFDPQPLVDAIAEAAQQVAALAGQADYRAFADRWRTLRLMQAAVDSDTWAPGA